MVDQWLGDAWIILTVMSMTGKREQRKGKDSRGREWGGRGRGRGRRRGDKEEEEGLENAKKWKL